MVVTIVNYTPNMLKKQVDLLWEITDLWDYPFGTSYASVEQAYSASNFDPSTRFYAIEDDNLLGYITSAVVEDNEKGDYGSSRFPINKGSNSQINDLLMEAVIKRFRELGIQKIRSLAGPGMGDTMEQATKYGFEQKNVIFKRSKISLEKLKISGSSENVREYNNLNDRERIKEVFLNKMGFPEEQSLGYYDRVMESKIRKEAIAENRTSWKIAEASDVIEGFSYFHRSDHNPSTLVFSPIWTKEESDHSQISDHILSAHVSSLQPFGLSSLTSFLPTRLLHLDQFYGKFGFAFDPTYVYEKSIA